MQPELPVRGRSSSDPVFSVNQPDIDKSRGSIFPMISSKYKTKYQTMEEMLQSDVQQPAHQETRMDPPKDLVDYYHLRQLKAKTQFLRQQGQQEKNERDVIHAFREVLPKVPRRVVEPLPGSAPEQTGLVSSPEPNAINTNVDCLPPIPKATRAKTAVAGRSSTVDPERSCYRSHCAGVLNKKNTAHRLKELDSRSCQKDVDAQREKVRPVPRPVKERNCLLERHSVQPHIIDMDADRVRPHPRTTRLREPLAAAGSSSIVNHESAGDQSSCSKTKTTTDQVQDQTCRRGTEAKTQNVEEIRRIKLRPALEITRLLSRKNLKTNVANMNLECLPTLRRASRQRKALATAGDSSTTRDERPSCGEHHKEKTPPKYTTVAAPLTKKCQDRKKVQVTLVENTKAEPKPIRLPPIATKDAPARQPSPSWHGVRTQHYSAEKGQHSPRYATVETTFIKQQQERRKLQLLWS